MKYLQFESMLLDIAARNPNLELTDLVIARILELPVDEIKSHISKMVADGILTYETLEDRIRYIVPGVGSLTQLNMGKLNQIQDTRFLVGLKTVLLTLVTFIVIGVLCLGVIVGVKSCSTTPKPVDKSLAISYDGYGVTVPADKITDAVKNHFKKEENNK